jgi:predicted transcriptional regulator
MACIDAEGNITRSAELMLLAAMEPSDIDSIIEECDLPPFRVRSGLRELGKAGLIQSDGDLFRVTKKGIEAMEGRKLGDRSRQG